MGYGEPRRPNHWQTDFTYLKITGWGFLSFLDRFDDM
jgi:hypothetical protein